MFRNYSLLDFDNAAVPFLALSATLGAQNQWCFCAASSAELYRTLLQIALVDSRFIQTLQYSTHALVLMAGNNATKKRLKLSIDFPPVVLQLQPYLASACAIVP